LLSQDSLKDNIQVNFIFNTPKQELIGTEITNQIINIYNTLNKEESFSAIEYWFKINDIKE